MKTRIYAAPAVKGLTHSVLVLTGTVHWIHSTIKVRELNYASHDQSTSHCNIIHIHVVIIIDLFICIALHSYYVTMVLHV